MKGILIYKIFYICDYPITGKEIPPQQQQQQQLLYLFTTAMDITFIMLLKFIIEQMFKAIIIILMRLFVIHINKWYSVIHISHIDKYILHSVRLSKTA